MKIKSTYQLREVAGEHMVVSTGADESAFNGVIMLNGTGAFLWKLLENGAERDELIAEVLNEYEVDEATATIGVDDFIADIKKADLFE
ncbi:MAG: PqqD family protein [Clostridia bacterium]|nr:PqqD family protein [Clostridia bacterium]